MITHDTIPCWYELSWREQKGIVLRIHDDFAVKAGSISASSPIVMHYFRDFGFEEFAGSFGKDFGFEECLKFLGEKEGFLEYVVPTPLVRKDSGKKCHFCEGSGKSDIYEDGKCLHCDGEGIQVVYDFDEIFTVSATLTMLFAFMRFPEIETSCTLPQLMSIQTVTIKDSHGGSVGGHYSREAVAWMQKRGAGEIPEMVSAMRSVWKRMEGRMMRFYQYSFRANLSDNKGWLCTDCPGDACGLHPSHTSEYNMKKTQGYEFSSHNVDSPMQQLTIIASLAALHDLIRKDTKK